MALKSTKYLIKTLLYSSRNAPVRCNLQESNTILNLKISSVFGCNDWWGCRPAWWRFDTGPRFRAGPKAMSLLQYSCSTDSVYGTPRLLTWRNRTAFHGCCKAARVRSWSVCYVWSWNECVRLFLSYYWHLLIAEMHKARGAERRIGCFSGWSVEFRKDTAHCWPGLAPLVRLYCSLSLDFCFLWV
jgi:hypothetical protein